jgi:hypothetical protein
MRVSFLISVNEVAYQSFRPPFMGGFNGANGAIAYIRGAVMM